MKIHCNEFPFIPVNPRLKFGAPLKEVCENGNLHPGLRELFLKAYMNAAGDNLTEQQLFMENNMLATLSAGPKGQGSLAERLNLKDRIESGSYIISCNTPPGAPLWLLRHFLGRLPQPLMFDATDCREGGLPFKVFPWKHLAEECRNAIKLAATGVCSLDRLKFVISSTISVMPRENILVLSALLGLFRNLAAGEIVKTRLNKRAAFSLTCFFTQAMMTRPFRPGFTTLEDRRYYPLVLFLIYNWPELRVQVSKLNEHALPEYEYHPRVCQSQPVFPAKHSSLPGRGKKTSHKKTRSLDLSNADMNLFNLGSKFKDYDAKFNFIHKARPNKPGKELTKNKTVGKNTINSHVPTTAPRKSERGECEPQNGFVEKTYVNKTEPLVYECQFCNGFNTINTDMNANGLRSQLSNSSSREIEDTKRSVHERRGFRDQLKSTDYPTKNYVGCSKLPGNSINSDDISFSIGKPYLSRRSSTGPAGPIRGNINDISKIPPNKSTLHPSSTNFHHYNKPISVESVLPKPNEYSYDSNCQSQQAPCLVMNQALGIGSNLSKPLSENDKGRTHLEFQDSPVKDSTIVIDSKIHIDCHNNITSRSPSLEENVSFKCENDVLLNIPATEKPHSGPSSSCSNRVKNEEMKNLPRVKKGWSFKRFRKRFSILFMKKGTMRAASEDLSSVKYTKISDTMSKT